MICRVCYFYQHHPNCTESVLADLHSSTYTELEEYLKNLLSRNLQNMFLTSLRFYSYFKGLPEVWGGGWRGDNRGQRPVLMPQLQPEKLHFWLYLLLKLPVVGSVQPDSLQPHGLYPAGSPIHGIFQARILEWVAETFSRVSSWPGNWAHISCASCIGRQIFLPLCLLGCWIQIILAKLL